MKEGYQLLRLKKNEAELKSDILPKSFIEFANKFLLGVGCFSNEVLRRDGIDFDIPLTNVFLFLCENEIELEYLYSIEQIHSILFSGENTESFYLDDRMVRIAHSTSQLGSSIFISIDSGQIFIGLYEFASNEKYIQIAESIFDMVLMLKSKPNRYQLNEAIKPLLYKNWGEDFWRVRE